MAVKSPLLVFTCFPGEGHFYPVLSLAIHLMKHGYSTVFIAEESLKERIEAAGIGHISTVVTFTEERRGRLGEISRWPSGLDKFGEQLSTVFLETLPPRVQRFHEVLEELKARDPGREIFVVEDIFNAVSVPYKLGRPLPEGFNEPPKTLGLGCAALILESEDLGPILMKLPPDSTPSGKLRNRALNELVRSGPLKKFHDAASEALEAAKCTDIDHIRLWNTFVESFDVVFQLCSRSMEYEISDLPKSVRFSGVLPRQETPASYQYPAWWEEVALRKGGRKLLFVSQGTVSVDYTEVIIPAIEAFGGRNDIILVAALGVKGSKLGDDVHVASNVKVIDYLPYDTILEVADCFVTNGGYGAFTHGIRNGCPMVIAGDSEEKAEVGARAAYAGVAVNLGVQRPTVGQLTEGVDTVLRDPRYRDRAMELRRENEDMDALETMRRAIDTLIA